MVSVMVPAATVASVRKCGPGFWSGFSPFDYRKVCAEVRILLMRYIWVKNRYSGSHGRYVIKALPCTLESAVYRDCITSNFGAAVGLVGETAPDEHNSGAFFGKRIVLA